MALTPLSGTLGKKRAAHLLRRACFGATLTQVDEFASLTAQEAIGRLFMTNIPEPPLPVDPLTGQEWVVSGTTDANSEGFELEQYFLRWHIGQMLSAGISNEQSLAYAFRERLVVFMHTHFTTKKSVVNSSRALYFQNALFRFYAFDKEDRLVPGDPELVIPDRILVKSFKGLTKKICLDNAMLVFLDGRLNVKGSPNENYARELMELYSIGRGLEGTLPEAEFQGDYINYTEEDVQQAARVLSGFNTDDSFLTVDVDTNLPRGVIKGGGGSHDNGIKTFSARMGGATIQPDITLQPNGQPNEESMIDEVDQLIEMIYAQPETARNIARKIYRFFIYHEINAGIQSSVIQDIADVFTANDFKLQPTLETLLTSREFYEAGDGVDDDSFGGIIKSPLDMVVGFMRSFGVQAPDYATDLEGFYSFTGSLLGSVDVQGMDYYEPFEVAGYSAYHQFPLFNRAWITTNYLTNRYNFIRQHLTMETPMELGEVNALEFVQTHIPNTTAANARALVIALAGYFLPMSENLTFDANATNEITVERLNFFMNAFLFSPQIDPDPEASWTFRWQNGVDTEVISNQLTNLLNAMLQSPEYQLM
ncbi:MULTISPECIES: DUF1800 family protein [unclassified Imperialibacter]|uniref:DUF1800 domain-containing protein n=1 Tax=unclassified Imperialibacter TaxID=2629706 RepID=UPI00125A9307|nr:MULTISPECIES: DUF1800 family protein [unclassified Imperialibacter]CAD5252000.1 conserved hypothetical protein [Imperialibacter sp. 75]CAD5298095.1 conserved hypothetical protein [Imperialibacter sp. 89]VVT13333.1 conserved hypothetical protein [Imperialibacter sp. EC-SDR9]